VSVIKVNKIENTSTADGGVAIDVDGHVTIDGQQLPTAGPLSNRNLIINGAMNVAQRGTSSTPTGGGYFTVDRFSIRNQNSYMGDIAPTYAQVEEAPAGFKYSQKVTIGTGTNPTSNDNLWLQQTIEGNNCSHLGFGTASAQTFTLSFWVRASIAGDYDLVFKNGGESRHYVTQYTIDTANTWEYKTITVNGDTSGTWATDNGVGLQIYWVITISSTSTFATSTLDAWGNGDIRGSTTCTALAATTGATFQITGVQVEVGTKSTPFEHRSYGDELQRCMRYFQIIDGTTAGGALTFGNGCTRAANNTHIQIPLGIALRDKPALSVTNTIRMTFAGSIVTSSADSPTLGGIAPSVHTDGTNFNVTLNYNGDVGYTTTANTGGIVLMLNTPGTVRLDSEL
jgi:hypothetical protein